MSPKHRYAAVLRRAVGCGVVGGSAAALVAGLAGCASGADDPPASSTTSGSSGGASSSAPSSSPPSTTTTSATTTTTASAVQIPEAARAHTEAGAEAFVTFFVEQSNLASMNADTSILPALIDESCKSCSALQGQIVDLKSKGHHYATQPVTVTRVAALGGAPRGQQFVRLQMRQNRVDVVDAAGVKVSTDPSANLARTTSLIWVGDRWVIFGIAH